LTVFQVVFFAGENRFVLGRSLEQAPRQEGCAAFQIAEHGTSAGIPIAKALVKRPSSRKGGADRGGDVFTKSLLALAVMGALPIHSNAAEQSKSEGAKSPLLAQISSTQVEATQNSSRSYAQELVESTAARHGELIELDLHATPPASSTSLIIASKNKARLGKKSDPDDLDVIRTGMPFVEINKSGDQNVEVHLPLLDANRRTVGEVEMTFPYPSGSGFDQVVLLKSGEKIRDEIARQIPDLGSLFQPAQLYEAKPIEPVRPVALQTEEEVNKVALGNKQSLPMTKEVTSSEALQNTQEGSDAIKNQAGVAPASSKGSPSDTVSIRGINLNPISNYRINGGLAVASVMTIPTEDKERLETLKGANALMFGIASPAGIINLVTKRATDLDVTTATLAGTSFGQYYGGIDVGRRFGQDKEVGLRANLSATHLENGVRGTPGNGELATLGADWKATDRLSFQGDVEWYRKHTELQAAVSLLSPVNGVVPVPNVPNPRNLLSGSWANFFGQTKNVQGRADFIITDGWKVIGELGRSWSERSRFVTRIGKYDPITGANGIVTVNFSDQNFVNKFERSELLGKFATGPFRHDLTLGLSASERDAYTPEQNTFTLAQKQNIFDPITLAAPVATKPPTSLAPQISQDKAFYGYDTIGILPQAKALVGFRRTESKQDNGLTQSKAWVSSPAGGFLYDLLPTTTLFASYMKGLEDGAVAPVNAVNANQILAPGISTQREIGIRDSYFRGLSISASYFYISRVNAVTDSVTNIFSNNGTIRFKGQEAVIAYEVNRQWTINAAGQHLKAVQLSDDIKLNGFVPENTPKFLGNLSVTHRTPLVPGLSLTAGASYVTQRFVNPQDQGTIPGYALYSVGAGYVTKIAGRRTSFQVNVDNLANKRYWNSAQQGTFGTGMDRSIKMNAKVDL
jgi:TonB-dependent siderophore receptor